MTKIISDLINTQLSNISHSKYWPEQNKQHNIDIAIPWKAINVVMVDTTF